MLVRDAGTLTSEAARGLAEVRAEVVTYPVDEAAAAFPFTARLLAAAHAEGIAEERGLQLVWMDSESLILGEPGALVLPPGKVLGCRPVDHANVGSPWQGPADAFWQIIYDRCGVAPEQVYPVSTTIDGQAIRAYFNAGLLAVRPEAGLLQQWRSDFAVICRDPSFDPLYAEWPLRRIFVHQAVLAATALSLLGRQAILELPPTVNYPLHMYGEASPERRPSSPGDLVTCRYENMLEEPDWQQRLPLSEDVMSWLELRVRSAQDWPAPSESGHNHSA